MFLLTIRKKFIRELTLIGVVLTALVAVVYHMFIPDRYFLWFPSIPIFFYLWFPSIPIFFYLFGLFYIAMFSFYYRMGLEKLVMCYLSCKVLKFILSALILVAYAFLIGHEVVAFMLTYVFFFFAFLIFETRFFLWFETKLKNSKKVNNEKITVHSTVSASVDGDDGNADGAKC